MNDAVQLRFAEFRDLEAVYEICLKTGDAGRDATGLYRDSRLIGHIYAGPYLALGGFIGVVAEDRDGVLGYAVGATDTRACERRLEREWWPSLRQRYPAPSGEPGGWSPDERRIRTIHHPAEVPDCVVETYPAHIHMNLLPRAQGQGVGSRLLAAWSAEAQRQAASSVHAGVNARNKAGLAFWKARGFEPIGAVPDNGTIWCGRHL
jgi:GNAT superfamily N-acetyltransferase